MNATAWNLLAERSRALVHQTSLLMGVLTHPQLDADDESPAAVAREVDAAVRQSIEALEIAPELAAHLRTLQRFETALSAWQRCVDEAGPLTRRYQAALLQQAAQVLTSCLHVEAQAVSEASRVEAARHEVARAAPEPRIDLRHDAS